MSAWNAVRDALNESQQLDSAVRSMGDQLARLLSGRLRYVNSRTLESLKRELREYNIQTKRWKDKQ